MLRDTRKFGDNSPAVRSRTNVHTQVRRDEDGYVTVAGLQEGIARRLAGQQTCDNAAHDGGHLYGSRNIADADAAAAGFAAHSPGRSNLDWAGHGPNRYGTSRSAYFDRAAPGGGSHSPGRIPNNNRSPSRVDAYITTRTLDLDAAARSFESGVAARINGGLAAELFRLS